ncbi:MAG: LTA synthase family protein [Bacteroidaceae bacterium]
MTRLLYLLRLMLSLLLFFAVGKLLFLAYNADVYPFGCKDVWQVWWHGLTMDVSTSGYVVALPLLLALISLWWRNMPVRWILWPYLALVSVCLAIIVGVDVALYEFWKFKLNAAIFSYMQTLEGAASSVSLWYMITRITGILLLVVSLCWLLMRRTPVRFPAVRHRVAHTCVLLLYGGLLFIGIRGGLQQGVMNVGVAYYSPSLFLNHSAVNPAFSLLSSLSKAKSFGKQFNWQSEESLARSFQGLYPEETEDIQDTLLCVQRPNVLVIFMESFGSKFVKELGGLPDVAPGMSRLIPQSILWEQVYSNSFRTDRGTVSAFSGWVSYPTASLMRLPEKLGNIPSLARSLSREGYHTSFLYGGDITFMNTKGYLVSTGYRQLVSASDFSLAQTSESKWGANDSVTARRVYEMIAGGGMPEPWHMTFQTLSSHEPFEVPYHRLEDKKLNAFAFTDHCIEMLVDSLRTLPVWDNLLVVLIPDHGFLYELTYESPEFFHAPMLWLGGAIACPRRMNVLMNQSDMAATLLSQMGIAHRDFPWSRNVLSRNYQYPFAYSSFPSGILFADSTGVSVYDITGRKPITEQPQPSEDRLHKAQTILQMSYDLLEALR